MTDDDDVVLRLVGAAAGARKICKVKLRSPALFFAIAADENRAFVRRNRALRHTKPSAKRETLRNGR